MSGIYICNGNDITTLVFLVMRRVCRIIAEERQISYFDALMDFDISETCKVLQTVENGFWKQSPEYIADRYFEEINC